MKTRGGRRLPSLARALLVTPVWVAVNIWLWSWWLDGGHVHSPLLFIPLTLAMLYEFSLLPSLFLYFTIRAKLPKRRRPYPGQKVAVITLCVPSKESTDVIEAQLKAMSGISYPHDSWVLDEGGSNHVKSLARKYGVNYFTRKGKPTYNQANPPFKAKTKAGNVNAWLKHVKKRGYDYFVQFDIDHLAHEDYLDKTLGHFRDKKVAWVQAPSVYKNFDHWTALGAAEQELVLQGPLQMGFFGHSETPFIIGSHCTYRMSAVQEIGGFQPTRAEDHLDTVVLANHGYKGVFIPEVIAEGDGPENLETYLAQQFAWAYSMFQVLLRHTPTLLKGMPYNRKLQFLFAQTWYPLWSLSYFTMFFVPVVALLANKFVITMSWQDFALRVLPLMLSAFLIWWSARPLMQPKGVGISWRGMLLHVVRWPVVLRAIISATLNIKKPYMITPKGKRSPFTPSTAVYTPFLLLGFINIMALSIAVSDPTNNAVAGQMVFAMTNVLLMMGVCAIDLAWRAKRAKPKAAAWRRYWLKPVGAVSGVALLAVLLIPPASPIQSELYARAIENRNQAQTASVSELKSRAAQLQELKGELVKVSASSIEGAPDIGVYDPSNQIEAVPGSISHSFIDWDDEIELAKILVHARKTQTVPLVTVEPRERSVSGEELLENIESGEYDAKIGRLLELVSLYGDTAYIRFAHEMDLGKLYPWGAQNPQRFVAAYRHVIDLSRQRQMHNVEWVWSPAGNSNANLYYPGDEYVDVIGTTVLHDKYWYGNARVSFADISKHRLWLKRYNKPLWVVELGVGTDDADLQTLIIKDAIANFEVAGFDALVYLNIIDSNIDGPDYRLKSTSELETAMLERSPIGQIETKPLTQPYLTPRQRLLVP